MRNDSTQYEYSSRSACQVAKYVTNGFVVREIPSVDLLLMGIADKNRWAPTSWRY